MGNKKKKKMLSALQRRKIGKENMLKCLQKKMQSFTELTTDNQLKISSTPLRPVPAYVSQCNPIGEQSSFLIDGENQVEELRVYPESEDSEKLGANLENTDVNKGISNRTNVDDQERYYVVESENAADDFHEVHGRRIIDINYLLKQLQEKARHNSLFDCKVGYFQLVGEKRVGLLSKFKFECNMCREVIQIDSEKANVTDKVNVNLGATTGIISAGIGYSQFEEILSAMDIPVFSKKYYNRLQNEVYEKWEKVACQSMEAAAKREMEAAIAEGAVKNGVPYVDVSVDGCWGARSYGTNYKALSGAAVIIGKKFGEVLYMGIKNKYCLLCSRADKKGESPKEHQCFKNYTESSNSMESEIIVEGFKSSLEMYGIAYARVIADGDSSTYAKILKADPYRTLNIVVEKIECRNHILRNFCKKLRSLTKETKYPLKNRKTLTDSKIMTMRKAIVQSILHHNSTTDRPKNARIAVLYQNILNSVAHAYGDHKLCYNYNCTEDRNVNNELKSIENTTFLFRVNAIVATTASKSRSLIENVNTNTVERFNSVIAKVVGGKRINFSQRRGYQARCSVAVVSFNNESAISSVQKSFLGKSPKGKVKEMEKRRSLKRKFNKDHPVKKLRKIQTINNNKKAQHEYGPNSLAPDITVEQMAEAKERFLNNLKTLVADRDAIERATVLQRDCSEWLDIKKNIITASNFGPICKRNPTKDTSPLVKNILYKKSLAHVASVAHGVENEKQAIQQMEQQASITIEPCGLFIDKEFFFIGASPDGLVGEDGLIEIKCPITAYKKGLNTAIAENKIQIFRKNKKNKTVDINTTSNWYFQIQGQLHVSERKYCLLGIWAGTNEPMHIVKIERDDDFWQTKMSKKLECFYKNCLLPEIVDPRFIRGMDIRHISFKDEPMALPGTRLVGPKNSDEVPSGSVGFGNTCGAAKDSVEVPPGSVSFRNTSGSAKDSEDVRPTSVGFGNTSGAAKDSEEVPPGSVSFGNTSGSAKDSEEVRPISAGFGNISGSAKDTEDVPYGSIGFGNSSDSAKDTEDVQHGSIGFGNTSDSAKDVTTDPWKSPRSSRVFMFHEY